MRHIAALLIVALVTLAPLRADASCRQQVSVAEAEERIAADGALVLDVRTPHEFRGALGHIEGALLIPVDQLEEALKHLDDLRDHPLIVVCRSGNRSATASRILCRAGFGEVLDLDGGMSAWNRAGLPVVHD